MGPVVAGRRDHIRSRAAAVGLWSEPSIEIHSYAAFLNGRGFTRVYTFAGEPGFVSQDLGLDVAVILGMRVGNRLADLIDTLRNLSVDPPLIAIAVGNPDPELTSRILACGVDRAFPLCPPNFAFYRQVVTAAHHALISRTQRFTEATPGGRTGWTDDSPTTPAYRR
ncbi:MAG: hypothetical protein ACK5W0_09035 [Labrys sp. (in: a-proteobacteria)]|jgi:hypothetical protein